MQYRAFGSTGLEVSVLGFGCGAVGGLMVRGEHRDMLRTVEYALESGINYFDTARMYGDGLSEIHTGAILSNATRRCAGKNCGLSGGSIGRTAFADLCIASSIARKTGGKQ